MRREDIRAGIRRRTAHLNEFVTLPLFAHPKFPSFPPNSLSEGAREEREREREARRRCPENEGEAAATAIYVRLRVTKTATLLEQQNLL